MLVLRIQCNGIKIKQNIIDPDYSRKSSIYMDKHLTFLSFEFFIFKTKRKLNYFKVLLRPEFLCCLEHNEKNIVPL